MVNRPRPIRAAPPWRRAPAGTPAEPVSADAWQIPRPDPTGTMLALVGLAVTAISISGTTSEEIAHFGALGVLVSIAVSASADLRRGVRNLVRADLLAIFSFYFLTLFEFLFPHPDFNLMVDPPGTVGAVRLCLIGFAGLFIGRHLSRGSTQPLREILTRPTPRVVILTLYWSCFFLGFWHMIAAVNFDFGKLIEAFIAPRFAQPWGRGQFGDWKALLVELAMLLNLVPPLAAIAFARHREYTALSLFLMACGLAFLLFQAFASGTRYIFHSYVITFAIGYAFAIDQRAKKSLFIVTAVALVLIVSSTVLMLQFRNMGLKNYLAGRHWETETKEQSLSVDLNLFSIAALQRAFPQEHHFIGLEVPYLAIIRPIPRAIWPGKPEGMSFSIEDAVGATGGWTVAATFVGEAYMSGGLWAVLATALFFGWFSAWWDRLASPANSQFGILIYASGFFAVVISMRSLFVFTTALLPTLVAIVGGRMLIAKGLDRRRAAEERPVPRAARRPVPAR